MINDFLDSAKKQFEYYKMLGEKTFAQLTDEQLFTQLNEESNSIAAIVKHMWGNMLSRWTDFLTSDGEKEWRHRDAEFENDIANRAELLEKWNEGWTCLFNAINPLTENDLTTEIFIRNQGHTITEAINRQLAHYPYHVGQIVFIGKFLCNENWTSLSIPKGNSNEYNAEKFAQPKHRQHFTDEYIIAKNFTPFPILTTERLTLRQLSTDDQQNIFALRSDTTINKYLGRKPSKTIEDAINFINQVNDNIQKNNSIYWAINLTSTKTFVGTICLFDFSNEENSSEIGYELMTKFQGQGIMTEAAAKVINYAFQTLQFRKIVALTHNENQHSTKLLTKFNFLPSKEANKENPDVSLFILT